MTTVVLVGGNGYIGREITQQWLERDPKAEFYVTSRTDRHVVEDPRVHHVQVNPEDAAAFEQALPESADYVVNLTYGSVAVLNSLRIYAERHGAQAIGNINAVATTPGFEDFVAMKKAELEYLRKSDVRVANVDLTAAYGASRDDELAARIKSGALDDQSPVHVEIVACLLIDRLLREWAE